jgi:serine protease Do
MMLSHKRSRAVRRGSVLLVTLLALFNAADALPARGEGGDRAARCSLTIPSIFDRVSPAVVYISATSINPYQVVDRVERAVGSGFIIDPSGLVLTNSHVAFPRQSLVVTLSDGTSLPARLVGADPIFDVALLRIEAPAGVTLPTVTLGDSDGVHVGEEAVAIGNPLGLGQTLTRGSVSAINRVLPVTFFSAEEPLLQIDTPINPGNSGGPLINQCGEAVGITTAVIPGAQNIGFAIPSNLVKALLPSLIKDGRVVRPWLGFHGQFVDGDLQMIFRINLVPGFLVEVVEPGSPAEKAGLQGGGLEITVAGHEFLMGGDIITAINDTAVNSPAKVGEALREMRVGSRVNLTVFREGKEVKLSYDLPERPILPGDIDGPGASFVPQAVTVPRPSVFNARDWRRFLR